MPVTAKATLETVREAVKQLQAAGKKATPTAVLKITHGSKSTVYKLMEQLQDEHAETAIRRPLPNLEELVTGLAYDQVKTLYEACKKQAEDEVLKEYQQMKENFSELRKVPGKLDLIEDNYNSKVATLKAKEEISTTKIEGLMAEVKSLKETVSILKEQLAKAQTADSANRATIEKLTEELQKK